MGSLLKSNRYSLLECFQHQHLSLVVPRYLTSNSILVAFPERYISVWIFRCHLVSLLAFVSSRLAVVVASSVIQVWAAHHYHCPGGVSIWPA